jgi:hypothetical protein
LGGILRAPEDGTMTILAKFAGPAVQVRKQAHSAFTVMRRDKR